MSLGSMSICHFKLACLASIPFICSLHAMAGGHQNEAGWTNACVLCAYSVSVYVGTQGLMCVLFEKRGLWACRRGWQVALDIARGLHWLHSRSLVHLDIKTSNVLLTADGRAKIADFGLSHFLSDRDYLSESVVQMGTFPYAAPEVLLASKVTTKADLFSFGVVLWELVTGE